MDMPTYVDEKNYTEKTHMSTGIIRIISVLSSSFFLKYEIQTESRKFNPWLKMDLRNVSSASECQSSVILD